VIGEHVRIQVVGKDKDVAVLLTEARPQGFRGHHHHVGLGHEPDHGVPFSLPVRPPRIGRRQVGQIIIQLIYEGNSRAPQRLHQVRHVPSRNGDHALDEHHVCLRKDGVEGQASVTREQQADPARPNRRKKGNGHAVVIAGRNP
jgi:hypothetical protein